MPPLGSPPFAAVPVSASTAVFSLAVFSAVCPRVVAVGVRITHCQDVQDCQIGRGQTMKQALLALSFFGRLRHAAPHPPGPTFIIMLFMLFFGLQKSGRERAKKI